MLVIMCVVETEHGTWQKHYQNTTYEKKLLYKRVTANRHK